MVRNDAQTNVSIESDDTMRQRRPGVFVMIAGHAIVLHGDCVSDGHALPAPCVGVTMVARAVSTPPPQAGTEQRSVGATTYAEMTQSTGGVPTTHACVLQLRCSVVLRQPRPQNCGCTSMTRVRRSVPPPHGTEQPDQSDHGPSVQLTEHCVTHTSVSLSMVGHGVPLPSAGRTTKRERLFWPLPHVRGSLGGTHAVSGVVVEHVDHWPNGVSSQLTSGMHVRLQFWSSRKLEHAAPPAVGDVTMARVRVCEPVVVYGSVAPTAGHVAEQVLNALHSPTTQFCGHGVVLQVAVSVRVGHAAPPFFGKRVTVRVRVKLPFGVSPGPIVPPVAAHDSEQVDHDDHSLTPHGIGKPQ